MQIDRLKVNDSPVVVNWQRQHVDMRTVVTVVVIPRLITKVVTSLAKLFCIAFVIVKKFEFEL